MKNYILLTLLSLFLIACSSTSVSGKPEIDEISNPKRLIVENGFLKDSKGNKVVLQGISYGWHNWWPRFYNANTVVDFAENWNCTVVRAAMGVNESDGYFDNPQKALSCVSKVVDAAIEQDIYVIIDWHSHKIFTEEAKGFFRDMATRYKGVPNVIYEIYNEPVDDSWKEVKQYAETVIAEIRSIDSEALILVGSPHWDQDIDVVANDPIIGYENIMYTLHFYANTHREDLRKKADYALAKGLPLFVSECAGMEASGDGAIDYTEWNLWREWMGKHSISWIVWSIADKDETCSMIYPQGSDNGNWPDAQLKEWGKFVKKELSQSK